MKRTRLKWTLLLGALCWVPVVTIAGCGGGSTRAIDLVPLPDIVSTNANLDNLEVTVEKLSIPTSAPVVRVQASTNTSFPTNRTVSLNFPATASDSSTRTFNLGDINGAALGYQVGTGQSIFVRVGLVQSSSSDEFVRVSSVFRIDNPTGS